MAQISATASHHPSDAAGFAFSFGVERINLANNSTPVHTVVKSPASSYFHANEFTIPFPFQNGFYIEGSVNQGGTGADDHSITLNTDTCHLYEIYQTYWNGSTLGAYSAGNWDLSQPFSWNLGPSATASGLSLFAGAIKWDYDLETGSINHALNFWVGQFANGPGVSLPADSSGSSGAVGIPYGAHLRLRASFPETGTPQMIAVIRALKKYGMYLYDTGSEQYGNGLPTITPADGNNGHFDFGGGASAFTIRDFELISPSYK